MKSLAALGQAVGMDRAVFLTVAARVWAVAAGVLTVLCIGYFLTPEQQGYYYTFGSLVGLQVLVELGLTYAIIQFASHEMAQLHWTSALTLAGNEQSKARLRSLSRYSLSWFTVGAVVLAAVLGPVGSMMFGAGAHPTGTGEAPLVPWVLLVLLSAVNLTVLPLVAILEGCGHVAEMAMLRLIQSVGSAGAVWVVLAAGGGLHALVAQAGVSLLVALAWLGWSYRPFVADLLDTRTTCSGVSLWREIWPFQWRIAASWVSGYLIFQLFSPILFATHGPVAAGQMGLSLQIIAGLSGVAMAWVTAKAPLYGRLIASGQGRELDRIFRAGLGQSLLVLVLSLLGALAVLWWVQAHSVSAAHRVLPFPLMAILAATAVANHVVFAMAAVLRAHKREPFLGLSVAHGLAVLLLCLWLIPSGGLGGAVAAYGVPTFAVSLAFGVAIFLRKRRSWWLADGPY